MDVPSLVLLACVLSVAAYNVFILRRLLSSKKEFGDLVRRLYNLNTIYLPAALAVLGTIELSLNRYDNTGWFCIIGAVGGVLVRVYATHVEPKVLRVRRVFYHTRKVSSPVTILHVSDFETDAVRAHEPRMFRYIRALHPDLLVHTGDLLNPKPPGTYETEFPKLCRLFASARTTKGILTVVGEVDRAVLNELCDGAGGMLTLYDSETEIALQNGQKIKVLGLTLEQSSNEAGVEARLEQWLNNCTGEDFTLLLGHRPDFIFSAAKYDIDLCLAGHTHGGQVRLPFIGALFTMSTVPRKLARGFHQVGKTWINVSAGVGFEHEGDVPAIRFNCPPEMTLITLTPIKSTVGAPLKVVNRRCGART